MSTSLAPAARRAPREVLSLMARVLGQLDQAPGGSRGRWPATLSATVDNLARDLVVERMGRWLQAARVQRLVELGCGDGAWSMRYLELAEQVVGVESDPHLVSAARRVARTVRGGARARFVHAPLGRFRDFQGADLVCLGAWFQSLPLPVQLGRLGRLAEILGPGRRLSLRTSLGGPLRGRVPRARVGYSQLFQAAGLKVEDGFFPSALLMVRAADELDALPEPLAARLRAVVGGWALRAPRPGAWADAHVWCLRVDEAALQRARLAA